MKSEQRVRAIIIIYERRNVVVSRRISRPDSFCIKISEAGSRPPNAFFLKCFLNPHLQNNFPLNPHAPPSTQSVSLPLQRPGPAGRVSGLAAAANQSSGSGGRGIFALIYLHFSRARCLVIKAQVKMVFIIGMTTSPRCSGEKSRGIDKALQ